MELAFKYRIYPNAAQRAQIARTFGCCRFVFNRALEMRTDEYEAAGKTSHINEYIKMIPKWKADPATAWLKEADSMALQQSLRDLDRAYKNFFQGLREGRKVGFPQFKKRRSRQSYRTNAVEVVDARHVKLPKLGIVKARVSRPVEGRILSATVEQAPSGKYFVSVCCTGVSPRPSATAGTAVGVDAGIKALLATSEGEVVENPRSLAKGEKKLRREQRRLSRRQKGSRNWEKQRVKVARVHETVADRRRDAIHKATTALADENQVVCAEDLNAKGMARNRNLAKAVADAAFGEVVRQLEYKCAMRGGMLQKVGRWYPSSKTCSCCGHVVGEMPLEVRAWECPECGAAHERDLNAARNILAEGLRLLAENGTAGHAGTGAASAA